MQTRKVIEGLGYTPHEAKVYLAALELGECLATDIAQKAELPLSSVQNILAMLHRRGLVNVLREKGGIRKPEAAKPPSACEAKPRRGRGS